MKKTNGFYVGALYDVGCDALAVGQTMDEVVEALMEIYENSYEDFNGVSSKEVISWDPNKTYYEAVLEIAKDSVVFHKFGDAWTYVL